LTVGGALKALKINAYIYWLYAGVDCVKKAESKSEKDGLGAVTPPTPLKAKKGLLWNGFAKGLQRSKRATCVLEEAGCG
jgi:hypothetical protein